MHSGQETDAEERLFWSKAISWTLTPPTLINRHFSAQFFSGKLD
jgi:hypothetical protein